MMKRIFSTRYSAGAFNVGMLLFRIAIGALMMMHGYDKLVHFDKYAGEFMNFMGLGTKVSLSLCIFAEFFCSILLILGFFTRLATIPLIITMCVIVFQVGKGDVFGKAEIGALYLAGYILILFIGPGKASVDGLISK